jgi:hypothetical protein
VARKKKSGLPAGVEPTKEQVDRQRQFQLWTHRVAVAKRIRKDWETEYQVEECERAFLGAMGVSQRVGGRYNILRSTVRTQKPNLFYESPKFWVRPKAGISAETRKQKAMVAEGVLQSIGEQDLNLKNAAGLALLQAYTRLGVLKTVHDPRMEPNPQAGQPVPLTIEGEVQKDPAGTPLPMMNPLTMQPVLQPEEVLQDQLYRYEWVDAKTLLLPDEGPDPSKWSWIGEEVTVPLREAKEDTRFPKTLREQMKSNVAATRGEGHKKRRQDVDGDELFKYYELYDLRAKEWLFLTDGQDFEDFLLKESLPDGIEDHPYSLCNLGDPIISPDPSPWPCPVTKSWIPVQDDFDTTMKMVVEGTKRAARKLGYDESTFAGPEELAKYQSSDDMIGVKLNDTMKPPVPIMDPPLPPDLYNAVNLLLMVWRIITGLTGARSGASASETATEATFVERAANVRDTEMQGIVNDWLSTAGKKMWQLVKATMTLEMFVRIRDFSNDEVLQYVATLYGIDPVMLQMLMEQMPQVKDMIVRQYGQDRMTTVTREDLTFEADVSIVPGSARPMSLDNERRTAMEFLTTIGAAPQLLLSQPLMEWIGAKFDPPIPQNVIMNLSQLAQAMMGATQTQAGHNPGSAKGGPNPGAGTGSTTGNPDLMALQAGVMNGVR